MTNDEFLQSQIAPILYPGEQVLQSAYMRRQPGLVMQMLVVGGLLLFLITKAYFVVITNRRMILIRTKMKFLSGGPKQLNLGIEEHDVRSFANCTTSGIANNKSMTFHLHQGAPMTLRISPWQKQIVGTPTFFEQVPQMITSGYLAQLAAGQPQLPPAQQMQQMQQPQQMQQMQQAQPPHVQQPHMQQPHMQQQQPQQQAYGQQGYPQPMQAQQPQMQMQAPQHPPVQPGGFAPGTRVTVTAQDGNRYPGVVAQAANGQYLCQMSDGKSYWFPIQQVAQA